MGCLLVILALLSPRLVLLLEWLFNNARFHRVFNGSFLWPLLGFIFLPWTTLMYFFVLNPAVGHLTGWGWFWVILALFVDAGSYSTTRIGRSSNAIVE